MKTLSIFTPSYNRAHLLPRLYKNLCRQTSDDFEWIVVDDGSADTTKELIDSYIKENKIIIKYTYKPNGGMHTAHNTAFDLASTELILCLDSDDILNEYAVELILDKWKERSSDSQIVGIVSDCLDMSTRNVLGKKIPENMNTINFYDIYYRYNLIGDKALVYLTSVIGKNPYPSFDQEKFVPLDMKYLEINENLLVLHTPVMEKEYQQGGYTKNIPLVYAKNPKAFAYYHKYRMIRVHKFKIKIKSIIHYIACSKLVETKNIITGSPYLFVTLMLYPLGIIWYCKLKKTKKQMEGKIYKEL